MIELHGDNADALEAMLRYLYTSTLSNLPSFRRLGPWVSLEESLFSVELAIVADKYGIDSLKQAQFKAIEAAECGLNENEVAQVTGRLIDGVAPQPALDELILSLTEEYCFVSSCRDERYREWLSSHPDIEDRLCKRYFCQLMKVPEFCADLVENGEKAVCYLKWLAKLHEECWDDHEEE